MKKACRFVALTAALAITASLAVPAFAKSADDKEGASVFTTIVGENHDIVNPSESEAAPAPALSTTEGTAPAASATTTDSSVGTPTIIGWQWLSFPEPSDDSN